MTQENKIGFVVMLISLLGMISAFYINDGGLFALSIGVLLIGTYLYK